MIRKEESPLASCFSVELIMILHGQQWEGLLELLGPDIGSAGGLEFLHRYFLLCPSVFGLYT